MGPSPLPADGSAEQPGRRAAEGGFTFWMSASTGELELRGAPGVTALDLQGAVGMFLPADAALVDLARGGDGALVLRFHTDEPHLADWLPAAGAGPGGEELLAEALDALATGFGARLAEERQAALRGDR
jgi:hypothetical protein